MACSMASASGTSIPASGANRRSPWPTGWACSKASAIAPRPRRLIGDLAGVPFVDSAGLGALIGVIRRTREAGGDVAISSPVREVTSLLRTTGFDRILHVTPTVEEAAAALANDDA